MFLTMRHTVEKITKRACFSSVFLTYNDRFAQADVGVDQGITNTDSPKPLASYDKHERPLQSNLTSYPRRTFLDFAIVD